MKLMRGRADDITRQTLRCLDPRAAVFSFVFSMMPAKPRFCPSDPGMSLSVWAASLLIAYIHQTNGLLANLP